MAADPATTAKKLEPSELIGAAQQVAIVRILIGLDAEASKWVAEAERLELVVEQWGEPEPEPESSFDNTHDNSTDSDGPPTPIQATALGTMPATRDADAEVARLEVAAEVAVGWPRSGRAECPRGVSTECPEWPRSGRDASAVWPRRGEGSLQSLGPLWRSVRFGG